MRVGLLADIHGQFELLRIAIERLQARQVDRFVLLGDVIDSRVGADETVELLEPLNVVGVWGNHELGLCVDPDDEIREMFSPRVQEFFAKLQPSLIIENARISHTFPTADATDPYAFFLGPRCDRQQDVDACFEAFPESLFFVGHFHRWLAVTSDGPLKWRGKSSLSFAAEKQYFVVVHAVTYGWAAIWDSTAGEIEPIPLLDEG